MSELQDVVLGNRYNLIQKIGEGGMALVYKAKDQLLNRYVAVKILRPEFTTDEEFINKFKRESLAAASLSHPNIVGIFDVGEQEGIYYIVMEYVCGSTLKEYIKECGRVNYREALNITNQIANALDHAHKNGVVHRDIKPHNILVTGEKIIKVTDFGIARASNSSTIINTGSVMGSVHYFSPEQARGNFTDHRTDIYSLGVVLYEMLTGSLPYDAESPVTVALKHIQEDFVQPTTVVNTVPEAINDIVVKAMEKDMAKRYQSIKELIDDIEVARTNPYQKIIRNEEGSQMTQKIPVDMIDKALNNSQKVKKKKGKKIAIILTIVFLVVAGLVAGALYSYNKYFIVKDVNVPLLVGLQEDQAKKLLQEKKLTGVEGEKQSSNQPAGVVLRVSPEENSIVKENSVVTLVVSSGAEKVTIPDLSNKSESDAELLLSSSKLIKGTVEHRNNDNIPKDQIISQDPAAGEQADAGSAVNIIISDGPLIKMLTVPELIGKTEAEAVQALIDANIKLGKINYDKNDNFIDDVVINQSALGDSQIPADQTIDITVNKTSPPASNGQTNQQNTTTNGQTNQQNTTKNPQTTNPSSTTP